MLNNESKIGKFLQIIRHQPLGLTLFFVIVFIIFVGFFFERNLALLIDQHQAYLFIDTFRIITVIGDATWWLVIFRHWSVCVLIGITTIYPRKAQREIQTLQVDIFISYTIVRSVRYFAPYNKNNSRAI